LILYYSHSKPPFNHSYIKPNVKINKKIYKDQKPIMGKLYKDITQGNINEISKSKIINKIPTKKNRTSNFCLESLKGSNPHSYIVTFSLSSIVFDIFVNINDANTNIPEIKKLIIIKYNII
jgi:hypothetical protein